MATELIINASLPETRIALTEKGEIQELLIERSSEKGIVGNIYKGRVTRVLPGMQAAFVDIGLEKAAFLYVDDVYVHHPAALEEEEEVHANREEALESMHDPIGVAPQSEGEPSVQEASPSETSDASPSSVVEAAVEAPPLEDEEEDDEEGEEDENEEPPSETGASESVGEVSLAPPAEAEGASADQAGAASGDAQISFSRSARPNSRRRFKRGRRGGRRGGKGEGREGTGMIAANPSGAAAKDAQSLDQLPENYVDQMMETGVTQSDRASLSELESHPASEGSNEPARAENRSRIEAKGGHKSEFRAQRSRDRRIPARSSLKPARPQVNIQDLIKEGQEVIVQVAKDPIATKGARLTCHISLPGRHLVCMPTIDHVGVSRRIDRDDERRRLREYVDSHRPKNLGFIVRTASGRSQSEKRIQQDIDYLAALWSEIRERSLNAPAPALIYEDLNPILRAIRDWVTEDIDKIIVDSKFHFQEIQKFVSHFMPSLKQKVELYHGDIPIFDAYSISSELSRALERKVWLKSGGYIVIDQAEALVAIDVNTGRYVGKKNLEDTILKTNLEAVQEIAYQLRLRNCGGIIIIDLIDMEKEENRHRVYRQLEEALKKDRARPSILKISELGLVEMTRKRTRDTMVRTLCESCNYCEGKGFVKNKRTVAYEVLREIEREGIERDISKVLVQANPEVIDILAIDERETLEQLERRYRKTIYLQAVQDFHSEQFEVSSERSARKASPASRQEIRPRPPRRDQSRSTSNRDREEASSARDSSPAAPQSTGEPPAPPAVLIPSSSPKVIISPVTSPPPAPIAPPAGEGDSESNLMPPAPPASRTGEENYDEEDRLAFLRAQAAQDAALARLGVRGPMSPGNAGEFPPPAPGAPRRGSNGAGFGQQRRGGGHPSRGGGGNNRRPGNGGKFRRNDRMDRRPPPAPGAARPILPITPVNATSFEPPSPPHSMQEEPQKTGGNGGNGDNDSGHSQPPLT